MNVVGFVHAMVSVPDIREWAPEEQHGKGKRCERFARASLIMLSLDSGYGYLDCRELECY